MTERPVILDGDGDSLTVLYSIGDRYATKRLRRSRDGSIHNRSYGDAKHFRVPVIIVDGFPAMCTALDGLTAEPYAFIVRGAPKPGVNLNHTRRLLHRDRKTEEEATFVAAPHHWFAIDLDHIPAAALVDPAVDPADAIEYLIGLLPPEFADVSCWWQFTSSQSLPGHEDTLSARLWFWNERPLTDAELTRWSKAVNCDKHVIDPCLYRAVQAHYIAAPIFDGWADPLPQRSGVRRGLEASVCLTLPRVAPNRPEEIAEDGYTPGRGVEAYLAEIGGPGGFRDPIKAAIASFIAIHGSKADCGKLKDAIRQAVDVAVEKGRAGSRDEKVIERYKSDQHLDELIAWIRDHHGDRPPKGWLQEPPPDLFAPDIPIDDPADGGINPHRETISLADFFAYLPQHNYLFVPTRELWPAASVNSRLPWITSGGADADKLPPSVWLDQNKPIEQMVWAPGEPMTIHDRVLSDGGWVEHEGVTCFNLYKPALLKKVNAAKAGRWVAHIETVYPTDAGHIIRWFGHRVQRPEVKLNHAIVLGGEQGIGKDSLIEPVKRAVGPWNFAEPSPLQMMDRFNAFGKSVILRISEARDLGDTDRYAFYEHLKVYTAAPPDVLRVDEKNLREYNILNCCGVVITTNHLTDGIYLPADDRRHYVAWSLLTKDDFTEDYWNELWRFYDSGGDRHVAAYLAALDLKDFNPKAPPPKTEAFWTIVNAGRPPEDAELATILELLGNPDAVTLRQLAATAEGTTSVDDDFAEWIRDRKNRRIILYRLEACGYVPVRNPDAREDKLWKIGARRVAVYVRAALSFSEQIKAARKLTATHSSSV